MSLSPFLPGPGRTLPFVASSELRQVTNLQKNPKQPTKKPQPQKKTDNFLLDYEIERFMEEFKKCLGQYKEGHRVMIPGAGKEGKHLRGRSE